MSLRHILLLKAITRSYVIEALSHYARLLPHGMPRDMAGCCYTLRCLTLRMPAPARHMAAAIMLITHAGVAIRASPTLYALLL